MPASVGLPYRSHWAYDLIGHSCADRLPRRDLRGCEAGPTRISLWSCGADGRSRSAQTLPLSEGTRSEYAELVALRVRKNDPGLFTLSYIGSCGADRQQSLDLGVSVVRS